MFLKFLILLLSNLVQRGVYGIAPQLTNLNVKWDESKMKVTIDFDFGGVDMSRLIYQSPDTPPLRLVITSSLPLQAETSPATNITVTSSGETRSENPSLETVSQSPILTGRIVMANMTANSHPEEEFEDYEKLLADDMSTKDQSNKNPTKKLSNPSSSSGMNNNVNNVLTKLNRPSSSRGTEVENDEVEILSDNNEENGPFAVFGGMDLSRLIYQATETPPFRGSSVLFDDAPPDMIDSSSSLPLQAETTTTASSPTTTAASTNTPTTTAFSSGDSSRTEDSSTESTTSTSSEKRTTTQSSVTTTGSSSSMEGNLTTTTESDANNNADEGFGDDEKSLLSGGAVSMKGKGNPAKKLPNPSSEKPSNNFSTKGRSNLKGSAKVPKRGKGDSETTSANVETEDSSFENLDPPGSIASGVKGGRNVAESGSIKGGAAVKAGGTKGGKVIRDGDGSSLRVPSFLPRSRRLRIRGDIDDHDSVSDLISSSRSSGFNNLRLRASSPSSHSSFSSEGGRRKKKSASRSRNSNNNRSTSQNSEGQTGRRSSRRNSRKRVSEVRTWRLEPLPDNLDLGYSDIPVRASRLSHRIVLSPSSHSSSSFFSSSPSSSHTRDSS